MNKKIVPLLLLLWAGTIQAQDAINYQTPPKEITDLALASPVPVVSIKNEAGWMLTLERNPFPSIEELAQPEYKVAGLRINAKNFSQSRQVNYSKITLTNLKSNKAIALTGLPLQLNIGQIQWNPSDSKIGFTQIGNSRVDLYVIDLKTMKASKVNKQALNVIFGGFYWLDDNTLIYRTAPGLASQAPQRPLAPSGPIVQENLGKTAPSVTLQDLIKSPYDEKLFEFLATTQLTQNKNGVESFLGKPEMYSSISSSPDKNYFLTRIIRKPFSYLVSYYGFPSSMKVLDRNAKTLKNLVDLPSSEVRPTGYDNVQNVPRGFDWRDDVAASITWVEPLDSGLIKKDVPFHDVVKQLDAPFTGTPKNLVSTKMRYAGITWGNADLALLYEVSRAKQTGKVSRLNPSTGEVEVLYERNTTDAYNDPGTPELTKNQYGKKVLLTVDKGTALLMNNTTGSSPQGDLPFLAKFNIKDKKNEIIWRCKPGSFETVVDVVSPEKLEIITKRETQTEVPTYFRKNLKLRIADVQLTHFQNPYTAMQGVSKEKITYKRADGIDLSGDLYLPKGYNKEKDGPLPVLIWAYPREFNSAKDAAQLRGSKDKFISVSYGGPIFFVTQGYAVLDNAEMPIVGKDGKRPNDTFVEQLKMNAEAAINKLSDLGVGDRNRVAVGGHSYGAFMTANLLAHTNLFKAGIARSGAYNRTLTPFGFQNEERTYWQAPELYYQMSPFSYADKIKTPVLFIHGEMDDNPGTFPINSERLYNAIKGHGGTSRLVYLPFEAHGYKAKENILHMLWEMNTWLNTYVKNAK